MDLRGECTAGSYTVFNRYLFALLLLTLPIHPAYAATKTWTGAAGDALWSNPLNWDEGTIPLATDDVLLNNSWVPVNYLVQLPNGGVVVRTLTIHPSSGQSIQVLLPASNLSEPGFTATGPGYGLLIENGGIFQNSSGMSAGESLLISDSIRIADGGKYIHNSRTAHANNIVRILSGGPGTSMGVFEFDVPRASYTVSMSNRRYGTLFFSAVAGGGTVNYTCSGSNPLSIEGNLRIDEGVTFSVDLGGINGNINIGGDLIQNGGTFNIASGAGNNTRVSIGGNLIQAANGIVTETNTGLPSIALDGRSLQVVSMAGGIKNDIAFVMNNHEGAILLAPLQLPYKLELLQGRIVSTSANLLTLQVGCTIIADSSTGNTSYVDGPMRKEGLMAGSSFLFPVGKNALMRWLELKNADGNFSVEYFRKDPRELANAYGNRIDHISAVEYWQMSADGQQPPSGKVELSFLDPGSGGVTDLSTLRVAGLSNGMWLDAGQEFTTGTFGNAGSVISDFQNNLSNTAFFALASSVDLTNPLPVKMVDFSARIENDQVLLSWTVDHSVDADHFDILTADVIDVNNDFSVAGKCNASVLQSSYSFIQHKLNEGTNYFRIRVVEKSGYSWLSRIIFLNLRSKSKNRLSVLPTIVERNATVQFNANETGHLSCAVIGMDGRICCRYSFQAVRGNNAFSLDLPALSSGIYQLIAMDQKGHHWITRIIKK